MCNYLLHLVARSCNLDELTNSLRRNASPSLTWNGTHHRAGVPIFSWESACSAIRIGGNASSSTRKSPRSRDSELANRSRLGKSSKTSVSDSGPGNCDMLASHPHTWIESRLAGEAPAEQLPALVATNAWPRDKFSPTAPATQRLPHPLACRAGTPAGCRNVAAEASGPVPRSPRLRRSRACPAHAQAR